MELLIDQINSEIGQLLIVCDHKQLCALDYSDYEDRMTALLKNRYGEISLTAATNPLGVSDRIQAYLTGDYSSLDDIPVNPGGAPFQQKAWAALRTIPVGAILSYGELAVKIGQPTAYRAVGMANSRNPIAIVIPCHRVIGSNGSLTGYAGGLARKRWLLEHEGVDLSHLAKRQKPANSPQPSAIGKQLSVF